MGKEHEPHQQSNVDPKKRSLVGKIVDTIIPPSIFGGLPHDLYNDGSEAMKEYKKVLSGEIKDPEEVQEAQSRYEEWINNLKTYLNK